MAGVKGRSGGHNAKPTKLLVLQGTARKDRHKDARKDEPQPRGDGRLPPPPKDLDPDVRAAWVELAAPLKFRIFTEEDVHSFRAFAHMWCTWKACGQHIQDHGVSCTSETKDGRTVEKLSPQAQMWSDLNGKLLSYFARFGMTPADRTRVREVNGDKDNGKQENPDDEFASA